MALVVFLWCFKDVETYYLVGASDQWKLSLSVGA